MDLRTNSDYFPIQHLLTGSYRDGMCLLRGTGCILTIQVSTGPSGRATVKTVSRLSLAAESRFDPRPVHVTVVEENVALGQCFIRTPRFFLISIIQPVLHVAVTRRTKGRSLGNLKKMLFWKSGNIR